MPIPDYRNFQRSTELYHYGMPRRSGRYPWGSGERPYQRLEGSKRNNKVKEISSTDIKTINRIKSFFQRNAFILDYKINKDNERWKTGMSYLSDHDFTWQEVEQRRYSDGSVGYFPPAQVIDEFAKAGLDNPYPKQSDNLYDSISNINPDFGSRGTTKNCTKTSAAVEMSKRGYNVSAGRQSDSGDFRSILNWFDGATIERESYSNIEDTLTSFGDNASGVMRIKYKGTNAGHAVNWTIDDGELRIEDGQNNSIFSSKKYESSDGSSYHNTFENPFKSFVEYYNVDTDFGFDYSRLDNCEPNLSSMADDSVLRIAHSSSKVRNKKSGRLVDTW